MKKILLLLSGIFIVLSAFAQSGVNFSKYNWVDAQAKAQEEKKLIFVDAYTSWCAPCKQMEKQVFPSEKVGNFFNENFISLKMDMEKGEGIDFSETYNVSVFPTLLFLDMDGTVVHRAAGFQDAAQLVDLGTLALDPNKRLGALDTRFKAGDTDSEFLYNYTIAKFNAGDGSHEDAADAYMATQENWEDEKNMRFIFSFVSSARSKMFDYLIENKQKFIDTFGQRAVSGKLQALVYSSLNSKDERPTLEQIDEIYTKIFPDRAAELSSRFRLTYYRQAGDREKYAASAVDYMNKFPSKDPAELNEIAWTFYSVIEDKTLLKKATKWAKKSIKMDNGVYNNDTLAALYFKLGKKGKAAKLANKAIAIAKSNNEDYSETEALLEKIMEL